MSDDQLQGALNPAFQFDDESTVTKEHATVEPDVQSTELHGKKYGREETTEAYNVSSNSENVVTETILPDDQTNGQEDDSYHNIDENTKEVTRTVLLDDKNKREVDDTYSSIEETENEHSVSSHDEVTGIVMIENKGEEDDVYSNIEETETAYDISSNSEHEVTGTVLLENKGEDDEETKNACHISSKSETEVTRTVLLEDQNVKGEVEDTSYNTEDNTNVSSNSENAVTTTVLLEDETVGEVEETSDNIEENTSGSSRSENEVTETVLLEHQQKGETDKINRNIEMLNRKMGDTIVTMPEPTNEKDKEALGLEFTQPSQYSLRLFQYKPTQTLNLNPNQAEITLPVYEKDEDSKWLALTEIRLKNIAEGNRNINFEKFKKALGVKRSFFAERFFELLDEDSRGVIELDELLDGLRMLMRGSAAEKLKFLFDVYDADAIGSIGKEELTADLKTCMEESSLSLTEENLKDLTDVLFEAADEDQSGTITFEELRKEVEKYPRVLEHLTNSAVQWLRPQHNVKKKNSCLRYFNVDYWKNNCPKVGYFVIYWSLHIILISVAAWHKRHMKSWEIIARITGFCLNFNGMWVVVPMLRASLTYLRTTKLARVLPLDQHILLHMMTAWTVAVLSVIHTTSHIANSASMAAVNETRMWKVLFTTKAGVGYASGIAYITGWMLVVILLIMVVCSLPFVRRKGYFQVFYWTHKLYVPFWILLLLHAANFWKWFLAPGVLFLLEKISRSKIFKMARYGNTFIDEVNLLHSGVTHLVISRPSKFRFKPGDYILLQVPEIATNEWHPFTISSAPEIEGHISLHVRSAGHWTNKLYKYFENYDEQDIDVEARTIRCMKGTTFENFNRAYPRRATRLNLSTRRASRCGLTPAEKHKIVQVRCYIDGPYGTGTRTVYDTNHAVLIGAGIGVTPMASILESVLHRFKAAQQSCPNCQHQCYTESVINNMKLKKVDFIWINRDPKNFEWFLPLLNQIELDMNSQGGTLQKHMHISLYSTAAPKQTDIKGIGLRIALDLMYEKSQRDVVTGLRTKIESGRPDWNEIFKTINDENKGKVKIFFCGAPALAKTLKELSAKHNFAFVKETF